MGSLAGQFLLEGLVVPFAAAGLILTVARRFGQSRRLAALGPLLALTLAVGTAYILAFGWPSNPALGARTKIMLSAIIGAIMGLVLERQPQRPTLTIAAGAAAIALWVGLPALQHGRPASALLVLPVALALASLRLFGPKETPNRRPPSLVLPALAVGLAAIAVFAKTFSLAHISLSLASALLAILIVGRAPLGLAATLAASAMLLALATALFLYSQASILALVVLGGTVAAGRLARGSNTIGEDGRSLTREVVFCLLPAAAALVIARIDAGPISLY
ncbi:MAG: hypothetical protein ACR2RA_26300 [Geminicoccaceae bacterium]